MNGGGEIVQQLYVVVVRPIMYFLIVLGIAVFVWGLIEFIASAGSDEGRQKGKQHIMWGLIGVTIMISVFGITSFVFNSLPDCPAGSEDCQEGHTPPPKLEE